MAQEQRPVVHKSSVGRPRALSAVLDTGDSAASVYDAMAKAEVWCLTHATGNTTFEVFGSRNRVDWRKTRELILTKIGAPPVAEAIGFINGYRYLKVQTDRVGEHEIEIVGAH